MLAAAVLAAGGQGPIATTTTTSTTTTTTTTATTTTTTQPTTLPPGVTILGVNVGGMTPAAAIAAVERAFAAPLPIRAAGHRLAPAPDDLGAAIQAQKAVERAKNAAPGSAVQVTITVRLERVRAYVATLAKRFDRPALDSKLLLRHYRPYITKGRPGRVLDRAPARKAISSALLANRRSTIVIRTKTVRQAVTRKDFGEIIVIRRSSNKLLLYRGMRLVRTFGVATGQNRYPTPLGRFSIVVKWRNPWWYPPDSPWAEGQKPIPPGPDNPLGTRWMGLSAPGVGIHGTNNDGSIGYSVSHGCIRMHVPDAEWLFVHVSIGTPVYIVAA